MNESYTKTTWPRFLAGAGVLLVVTFTLLMPVISDGLTGVRLALFWTLHIFVPLGILQIVQLQIMQVDRLATLSPWVQILISGFIGALVFSPIANGLDQLFQLDDLAGDDPETYFEQLIGEFTGIIGIVMVVWLGLNATRLVQIETPPPQMADTSDDGPEFWSRVPKDIGRDVVALSAELHYLRVYTVDGDALILFSFGRAVEQLDGRIDGVQLHRSHWVALAHVAKGYRSGKNGVCETTTGLKLPVSRQRRAAFETAMSSAT